MFSYEYKCCFFLYWFPAFVEYEQRISSIDFWDPVKFEVTNAARTRHSNQWIRDRVPICRGRKRLADAGFPNRLI